MQGTQRNWLEDDRMEIVRRGVMTEIEWERDPEVRIVKELAKWLGGVRIVSVKSGLQELKLDGVGDWR